MHCVPKVCPPIYLLNIYSTLFTICGGEKITTGKCTHALKVTQAFDTVRHHTLLQKLAMLNIPDCVYNWMVAFF